MPSLEHIFERTLTGREPFIIQPESRDKNIRVYDINGVKEMVEALEHTKHQNGN